MCPKCTAALATTLPADAAGRALPRGTLREPPALSKKKKGRCDPAGFFVCVCRGGSGSGIVPAASALRQGVFGDEVAELGLGGCAVGPRACEMLVWLKEEEMSHRELSQRLATVITHVGKDGIAWRRLGFLSPTRLGDFGVGVGEKSLPSRLG